jgi:type III secretion protein O
MKTFGQLVTVKELREQKAERTALAQARAVKQATEDREKALRDLEDYREYAKAQETRIYDELCKRPVRMRDIENARSDVLLMRQRETEHRDNVEQARVKLDKETVQLDLDRTSHRVAMKVRDKFFEMRDRFAEEARDEAARTEDAQIEEVAEIRKPVSLEAEVT